MRSRAQPGPHHVFGLSIDEQVQWATALTDGKGGVQFETIRTGALNDIGMTRADCQKKLTEALAFLKQAPEMFKAIGVSTIGVVDPVEKLLLSIALKNWFPGEPSREGVRPHLVDFKEVFCELGITSVRENEARMNLCNDATAAALAEYFKQREQREINKLVYLRFDEGVNGGIIINDRPLPAQLNVELGHVYPPIHEYDRHFPGVCPVHGACYEGLVSNMRIRKSWDRNNPDVTLSDLPEDHEAWEIFSYYIAHLCLASALVVSPERIILGGSIVCGRNEAARRKLYHLLFPRIWSKFERLNGSYPPYGAAKAFIEPGVVVGYSGVIGALRMAAISLGYLGQPLRVVG